MKMLPYALLPLGLLFVACGSGTNDVPAQTVTMADLNPAAAGFDETNSDGRAVAIADSVMIAHGGRRAYDNARFFEWNFFGARSLTWDKQEQRVRIEVPDKQAIYLLDYSDPDRLTGAVQRAGEELTDPDSLALYLIEANSMFINDSYWLVQPFKLKDSGVTLHYVGEEVDPQENRPSEVIELTFSEVGDTPGNRYRIFVDKDSHLFNTWQFFRNAADTEPAISTPYRGYGEYDGIMLSSDRGGRFQLSDIAVTDQMDESVFEEF